MSETSPSGPESQRIPYEDILRQIDGIITEDVVPEAAELFAAAGLASDIQVAASATREKVYTDRDGNVLDASLAERVIAKTKLENWLLSGDEADAALAIRKAKSSQDLDENHKADFHAFQGNLSDKKNAFVKYQDYSSRRLELSNVVEDYFKKHNAQATALVPSETEDKPTSEVEKSGAQAEAPEEHGHLKAGSFDYYDQIEYKNGAKHVYGVDGDGKRRHLSHDAILKFYGHEGDYGSKQVPVFSTEPPSQPEGHPAPSDDEGKPRYNIKEVIPVETTDAEEIIPLAGEIIIPVTDGSRRGIRNRVRTIMAGANAWMTIKRMDMAENRSNPSTERRRKLAIAVGAVAGAALVGVVAYLELKGGSVSLNGAHGHQIAGGPHRLPHHNLGAYPGGAHSPIHGAVELSLTHKGDTMETEVSRYLHDHGYKASEGNIDKVTRAALRHQGIAWNDARHLPVGYHFGVPREVLESLEKVKS